MGGGRLIGIGASLGGTNALQVLLPALPREFPDAIVLVFHHATDTDGILLRFLRTICRLPVEEVQDKALIRPGCFYYAPADYHLLVEGGHFALSTEAAVSYARPSIDVFFESAADTYGKNAVGILLTGAGHDGAAGLAAIKRQGGLTIIQAPETAECKSMPNAALATGQVDKVLTLQEIVPFLVRYQDE